MNAIDRSAPTDAAFAAQTFRKISLKLIPLLAVCYGIAYVDRVNVGFAALQMNQDLQFSASVYGLGAGLFFVSYAALEVPANLMLLRFGARRWISRIMITWGILAGTMMFIRRPWEFYLIRLLLGAAEAGFFPGVVYYLTLWFPSKIQARAISNFYVAIPLSVVFMGSASGFILDISGFLGLAGWKWMFLIEALPAILLGILLFVVLPDGPANANWLSTEERAVVAEHLASDSATSAKSHRSTLREAVGDLRIWQIAAFMFPNFIASYAYSFTAPLLIREITRSGNKSIGFITAAISLVGAVAVLANGRIASSKYSVYPSIIVPGVMIILGCLGVGLLRSPILVIVSLALIPVAHYAIFGPVYALAASFLAKRGSAGGLALINSIGIIGGFIGPYYVGLAKDFLGSYERGFLTLTIPCLIGIAFMIQVRKKSSLINYAQARSLSATSES
jgi:ACS family tartrate transporter-like MFS transporter